MVGILPGKRDDWKQQSIVLGAHYDHLGFGWPDVRAGAEGKLHPGADDNASGVAVMLELARNLAAEGGGSRNAGLHRFFGRRMWPAGDRKHYVAHPSIACRRDSRGHKSRYGGPAVRWQSRNSRHATADEWQHIFRGCGFVTGIPNQIVPGGGEASDQMSFIEKGIPAVQVFTGAHGDYHRLATLPTRLTRPDW